MNQYEGLALAAQQFSRLVSLCAPEQVSSWKPTDAQRTEYVRLGDNVLDAVESFRQSERSTLVNSAEVRSVVAEAHYDFLNTIEPRIATLRASLDTLDPDSHLLRAFSNDKQIWRYAVRSTFEQGLEQMRQLLERNPDWEDSRGFVPDTAEQILASELLNFEPDQWLNRLQDLGPIRSAQSNFQLPGHVRLRLEEIFRAYTFGLWISVLGLARSILEYSILDNASRLDIETWRPRKDGSRKNESLEHLCDSVAAVVPKIKVSMDDIRTSGNEYLHPKRTRVSREGLFKCERDAKRVMPSLVQVVGAIYGLGRETK